MPDHHGEYESLSSIVEDPAVPYGLEYVSLLARRGKINAHKEGRNWVSTKEDVIEYAQQHKLIILFQYRFLRVIVNISDR